MEMGPDQGIFYIVARKLLDGGLLYRDIIDIKPPLIYYMYAGAIGVLGEGAFSIRVMDVVLQLATCWMLWTLVKRVKGGELAAALAIVVYVLILLAQVAQSETESYVGLFALPAIWGAGFRRTQGWLLGAGLCMGALTLLKYSFGIGLAGTFLLVWFTGGSVAERLRMIGWVAGGWLLAMLPFVGYMALPGVFDAYREVWSFTTSYTASSLTGQGHMIKNLTSVLPWTFNESFSLLFSIAAALGVGMGARVLARNGPMSEPSSVVRLIRASVLFFVLLLVSVVFEARFHYQLKRLLPFMTVMAAFGSVWAVRRIAAAPLLHPSRALRSAVLVAAAGTALYLSPLITALWRTEAVSIKSIARMTGRNILPQIVRDENYTQAEKLAGYVRARRVAGDELFVLSGDAGTIYDRCGIMPTMRIVHSAMYSAPFAPQRWKKEAQQFLVERLPRFLVIQVGERGLFSNGDEDVLVALRSTPVCAAVLDTRYREVDRTEMLRLFERIP